VLRNQLGRTGGAPANLIRGDSTALPLADRSVTVVVTDPPYDNMIDYSDASDLFYVWLKRALLSTQPWFAVTTHDGGVQEKEREIIVKRGGTANDDHRTKTHYDRLISEAFAEARRVVHDDGLVTIVFGHGDPEVWHRLLGAITGAGLVLTGSWPAKTEAGGSAGSANIVTTLTMACRPAPAARQPGRAAAVEAQVKEAIADRVKAWDAAGLATTDMLMASAGPAMEVVGQYSEVLDARGEPVDPARYLSVARRAVQEAQAISIDATPLESFDRRTQFALWWIRLFGRDLAPKSEVRWQALAADLDHDDIRYLVPDTEKGARLVTASKFKESITPQSPVIDVAFAIAKAYPAGLDEVGAVLAAAGRDDKDEQLWGAVKWLTGVPTLSASDPDVIAWTQLLRNRGAVASAVDGVVSGMIQSDRKNRQMMIGEDMGDDE
jgi:adenine-specific DNA methylase